ncbi:unnamed protein product [Rhizopus stolonifer]
MDKRRPLKRSNYQKQEAVAFLSNITLGNENEPSSKTKSSRAVSLNFNARNNNVFHLKKRMRSALSSQFLSSNISNETDSTVLYKLQGEDSQRLIASEKIKKKSENLQDNETPNPSKMGFVSVFRYYRGIIYNSKKKPGSHFHYSYVHELLVNRHIKNRQPTCYSHFLSEDNYQELHYDPNFLKFEENEASLSANVSQVSIYKLKQEINEKFRAIHPEILSEMTLSKIKSVKLHLLNITKAMDLELSSLSHAYVYFEKLLQKNIITKQNRKLVAACCLYLAVKINEPKGVCFRRLLELINDEFDIGPKKLKEHEFAVFADLEFNLYVPTTEFMPHFDGLLDIMGQ